MPDSQMAATEDPRLRDADELDRLVAAVERIADAIGGIQELAIRLAPAPARTPLIVQLGLTPDAVTRLRTICDDAASVGLKNAAVPLDWLRALAAVLDDPRGGR